MNFYVIFNPLVTVRIYTALMCVITEFKIDDPFVNLIKS